MNECHQNIFYKSDCLVSFYSNQRNSWNDFYPSERWIFEKISGEENNLGKVLDVGCAAGGLGRALNEKFLISEYTGVEINKQCVDIANEYSFNDKITRYIYSDILNCDSLPQAYYNNVFSLSCADWNVLTEKIIKACWDYVIPEGHFVLTLRLTPEISVTNMAESYQYIHFGNELPENKELLEKAPYVVLNITDALSILANLKPKPKRIIAYGYWGEPSLTAVTPYKKLVFSAIAVQKSADGEKVQNTEIECIWPLNLLL